MSGTGSIYDLCSDVCEREINFRQGEKYAVVLAAYYGDNHYTTHRTAAAAIRKSKKMRDYAHSIIDSENREYDYWDDDLIRL